MVDPTQEEKFKLAVSIMGNEILGFNLESSSHRKNWIVIAFIFLIGISVVSNQLLPVIEYFWTTNETTI